MLFIDEIAKQTGVNIIDLHAPMIGKGDLVPDHVHPNQAGATIIATAIQSSSQ